MTTKKQPTYFVGYTYKNKQGLEVEVVEYRGRKDITVEFKIDGERKNTTGTYIKKSLPMHPTFNKPFVGQQFSCHDGDVVEIVEIYTTEKIRVKWLSDDAEAIKGLSVLQKGHNRHPTKNKAKQGDIYKTNNYGDVVVVEFVNATNVLVRFDDGTTIKTTMSSLSLGNLAHPTRSVRLGQEYVTNSGWKGVVTEYKDALNVLVKWQDGSESWHPSSHILSGSIKPLMQPSLEGIGYFGVGRFVPYSYSSGEHAPEKIYAYWSRMINRCYNEKEMMKSKGKSYIDKFVRDDWHNFQSFVEWALTQPNWHFHGFELDKDLLVKGNKVYSQDACCFLPQEVNSFLAERADGEYGKGVNRISPKTPNSKEGFIARCFVGDERKYLGFFSKPEEAFAAYKKCKEDYAKVLAEKRRDQLTNAAYNALMSFTVEP